MVDCLVKVRYNTLTLKHKGADMRKQTNKLIDMMDQGLINADTVAEMCLAYMSEDDVAGMMLANDILEDEDEEDDEFDGQPDEAQEWESFDPDC